YARFTGAPLKVHKVTNPWRSPSGCLPALRTKEDGVLSQVPQILTPHLRPALPPRYNADYDLSGKQGADTLAFVSLLEEKLLPALVSGIRRCSGSSPAGARGWSSWTSPYPPLLPGPGAAACRALGGVPGLGDSATPLSPPRMGANLAQLSPATRGPEGLDFGAPPASLDAWVFSHLAPLLKAKLPNGRLQQHLRSLPNLVTAHSPPQILPWGGAGTPRPPASERTEEEEEPYRRCSQLLSVLVGLA
uniref:Metaxin-1 n=1 Tax=Pelodiscus sinensis TaxID=13735 RepID=K7FM71_PELSI